MTAASRPLPNLGVGTAAWKSPFPATEREAAVDLVRYAVGAGAALFDTAPLYGTGTCERWLGEALQGIPRDRFAISTKAGYVVRDGAPGRAAWSREHMHRSVRESLERIGVDWLDIVHLHDPDDSPDEALEVALPALEELRATGVVRALGVGTTRWQALEPFIRYGTFDYFLLAGRYTLLEQDSRVLLDQCVGKGIRVILGGVYNSGILATGAVPGALYNYAPARPDVLAKVRRIESVCLRHGVDLRSAALRFALAHTAVVSLVVGSRSVAEYAQTRDALARPIPAVFWRELAGDGLIAADAPVPAGQEA